MDNSSGGANVSGGCGGTISDQIASDAEAFDPNDPKVSDNTEFRQDMADQGYTDGGTVCFDSNCAQIPCNQADTTDPCTGNATLYSSPIILSLGEEQPYTVVQFPLNPADSGSWVIWKGSGTHPLLVYDPEETGVIKDGSQLFGNYTFRGSDRAPADKTARERLWDNGYQALASLDRNGDGVLTDSILSGFFPQRNELRGLALWFDENRNAISEPGEVRPLSSIGVTKLRTSFDTREHDGDLVSLNGFEREDITGDEKSGNTLDWFSGAYPNKDAAVRGFAHESPSVNGAQSAATQPQPLTTSPATGESLQGKWVWEMDDEKGRGGRLVLVERGSGLFGVSILEFKSLQSESGQTGRIEPVILTGTREEMANGKIRFEFETGPQKEVVATSRGTFDPVTGELKATSEVRSGGNILSYSWHARRVSR